MKRFEVHAGADDAKSISDNLKLVELDPPKPADGEVLVRVRASSLNSHDHMVASGILRTTPGRVPLTDGVGEVVEVGSQVNEFAVGDRVMGTFFANWIDGRPCAANVREMRGDQVDGYASEYVALPASAFTPAPDYLTDVEAATMPCAALTAWRSLIVEGGLKAGDTVLTQGTGGVSIFAVQLAKMCGATVIATSSSEQKIARLKELGADHTINYLETPAWGKVAREMTGGVGVDHVVEVAGGDLGQTMRALSVGGNVHMIGALSNQPVKFGPGFIINGNATIRGVTVGSRQHQLDMVKALEVNRLKPVVDQEFALEELVQAFECFEKHAYFGKIGIVW